ncbi:MAG: hypothetical protein MUF66_02780 [Gammaproteobacteria bacterium]|nr:hypothetical protein [Gammaproteobacteria bacterium]
MPLTPAEAEPGSPPAPLAADAAARERALLMLGLTLEACRSARPGDTPAVALGRLADHLAPAGIAPGAWRRCLAHVAGELEGLLPPGDGRP